MGSARILTQDLVAAGLGARSTLLDLLPQAVAERWPEKTEGHGHTLTSWTMVPPLRHQVLPEGPSDA